MKQLWLRLDPKASSDLKSELLNYAVGRCDVAVLSPNDLPLASSLKLKTASTDPRSQIRLLLDGEIDKAMSPECAAEVVVKDRSDEKKALELADRGIRYLIVRCPNWKIIPLENLIAQNQSRATLLADVVTVSDAKVALQTLELGVDGVVITPQSTQEIEQMNLFLNQLNNSIPLTKATITAVRPIGSGARVCVDTIELMEPGEGILVGSQSSGLFLVEAEVHRNPHVEPRPFRVNAGPVSSYVLTPSLKTKYLSELKAGDEVLIINRSGSVRTGHVGRVKIERRPMMLVESEANGRPFSLIVQNAETVRLISNTTSKPVSELESGDEILIRVEDGGRHFGTLVEDEMVIER